MKKVTARALFNYDATNEEEVITPSRLAPVVANDLMMKGAIPGYGHKGDQQSKGAKGSGNPGEKGSE